MESLLRVLAEYSLRDKLVTNDHFIVLRPIVSFLFKSNKATQKVGKKNKQSLAYIIAK